MKIFKPEIKGNTTIQGNLTVTDTLTAEKYITEYITSSVIFESGSTRFGNDINDKHEFSGSLDITGSLVLNGTVTERVISASFISSTASLDMQDASFYTLGLSSGDNYIEVINPAPGRTLNLEVSTVSNSSASFNSTVKQISGSAYSPTDASSKDILSFISFDTESVYLTNIQNLV